MGPWGYVLANHQAGAQVVSTILYDGKPEYFAIMVTHPNSGINKPDDLKGRTFAFGDKGSTSGYLIPLHYFMTQGINPERYFSKVVHTSHQAIETQVTQGVLDAGADYNRNRNAMIEQGLIKAGTVENHLDFRPAAQRCLRRQQGALGRARRCRQLAGRPGGHRRSAEDPTQPAAAALHRLCQP